MKTLTAAAAALALVAPAVAQQADELTLIASESERYGEYLATARARSDEGKPVYVFSTDIPRTDDQEARMTCTSDKCVTDWTPVVGAIDSVGEGVDLEMVGTIARRVDQADIPGAGEAQVILYNGWPLYHFEMDQVPMTDEPQGQGDVSFGGTWYLISPSGEPIVP